MEMNPYAVLVRTDTKNRITEIKSSAFVADANGWTKIDEGWGDKYHHAQGNYLPKPLMDERGVYRYKLEEGHAVERTQEEMEGDYTPPVEIKSLESRVGGLENEVQSIKTGLLAGNADMAEALALLGVSAEE